jgi:hypothetical protein
MRCKNKVDVELRKRLHPFTYIPRTVPELIEVNVDSCTAGSIYNRKKPGRRISVSVKKNIKLI